jgi:triosephosphate isomerase (TIM)
MTYKRRPVVVGNWKMNLSLTEATELARGLLERLASLGEGESSAEVGIAPSTPFLSAVINCVEGSDLGVSAQHMSHHRSGAFTGESAPSQLADIGCRYIILGHSERRQYYGETNESVSLAARAAHDVGLTPILCVGETLSQRDDGETLAVVLKQVEEAFKLLSAEEAAHTICAYEPVWAIGTGRTATPEQAQDVHYAIRQHLKELYSEQVADRVRLQYGGSVKPGNATGLMSQADIDGALVGGASLDVDSFQTIIHIASTDQ